MLFDTLCSWHRELHYINLDNGKELTKEEIFFYKHNDSFQRILTISKSKFERNNFAYSGFPCIKDPYLYLAQKKDLPRKISRKTSEEIYSKLYEEKFEDNQEYSSFKKRYNLQLQTQYNDVTYSKGIREYDPGLDSIEETYLHFLNKNNTNTTESKNRLAINISNPHKHIHKIIELINEKPEYDDFIAEFKIIGSAGQVIKTDTILFYLTTTDLTKISNFINEVINALKTKKTLSGKVNKPPEFLDDIPPFARKLSPGIGLIPDLPNSSMTMLFTDIADKLNPNSANLKQDFINLLDKEGLIILENGELGLK